MTASLSLPSMLGYDAVTRVQVLEIPMNVLTMLMNEHVELLWLYNAMLQKALMFHWEIKNARAQYDAKQRYIWFLQKWPQVEAHANSKHIASFLVMSPETLSRIRSQISAAQEVPELFADWNSEWTAKSIKEKLDAHEKQNGEPVFL